MDDGTVTAKPAVEFTVKNLGKSAAIMSQISYQLIQGAEDQRLWDYAISDVIVDPVIEGGDESKPPTSCQFSSAFCVGDSREALDGDRPLYFYGHISFVDTFNREHTYYWRYRNDRQRFVLVYQNETSESA